MVARTRARRRQLPGVEVPGGAAAPAHGLRERRLPEPGRVLEPAHGHVHDPGRRVHAALRLLRGREGRAAGGGLRRAAARGGGGRGAGPALRRRHQRQPRRPEGRRRGTVRAHHPRHSRAPARVPRRGAHPRFPGLARGHGRGPRRRPGRAESQHRDGAAAVPPGAPGRALRALARHPGVLQDRAAGDPHQVRADARAGRNPRGSALGHARPARAPGRYPHAGPVSAALPQAPAGDPLPPAGRVRRARRQGRKWVSGTSRPARWCAAPTTPRRSTTDRSLAVAARL